MIILMEDRDVLTSHLEASKENVDSKIGDKETEIVRTLQDDWRQTETRILEEQHMRNRNIIEEIIKTCENFREDIRKSFSYFLMNLQKENSESSGEKMNDYIFMLVMNKELPY